MIIAKLLFYSKI